ncbi:MAG: hypothetical protein ACK4WH_06045 [Phycisphaerales bacterium]
MAYAQGLDDPPKARPSAARFAACDADWTLRVVEMQGHRRAPVVTAWLSNGVCVHHKRMPSPAGQIVVTINLIGGELLEGPESRGISMAAAAAWKGKSIREVETGEAARLIQNRDVYIEAASTPASLQLRVWGSREDVEAGLRVVSELLTRPEVEAEAIEEAAKLADSILSALSTTEQGHLRTAVWTALYPPPEKEPRTWPAQPARIRSFSTQAVQKWLDWHIESAPVEAAIVGDVTLEQAMRLAGGFLGRMPNRDRISPRTLSESRRLVPPPLPLEQRIRAELPPGAALAIVGFMGGDEARPAELRLLTVGARLLNEAVKGALSNAGVETAGVGASVVPAAAYPGFGAVILCARVSRADADVAAEVMTRAVQAYIASDAPAGEQEKLSIGQFSLPLRRQAEALEADQRYWSTSLARTTTLGIDIDELADAPMFYGAVEADSLKAALRRNAAPERMFRVIVGGP